jgi:hypothetical protein
LRRSRAMKPVWRSAAAERTTCKYGMKFRFVFHLLATRRRGWQEIGTGDAVVCQKPSNRTLGT